MAQLRVVVLGIGIGSAVLTAHYCGTERKGLS